MVTGAMQSIPVTLAILGLALLVGFRASAVDDDERADVRSQWIPTVEIAEAVSPLSRVRAQLLEAAEPETPTRVLSITSLGLLPTDTTG